MARIRVLLALTTLAAGLVATGAAPAQAGPYCGIVWGSTQELSDLGAAGTVVGVRTGQHPCFDRLVIDLTGGPATGYSVTYVPQITADGSGAVIPTRGGAALQVVAHTPAIDSAGNATYRPANPAEVAPVSGYRTFRQVVWGNTFEGFSTIGLGVRARLPFRVLIVPGPGSGSRLVVDVAHRW